MKTRKHSLQTKMFLESIYRHGFICYEPTYANQSAYIKIKI